MASIYELIEEDRLEIEQQREILSLKRQLKQLRLSRGLTVADVAAEAQCSSAEITGLESLAELGGIDLGLVTAYLSAVKGFLRLQVRPEEGIYSGGELARQSSRA